MKIKQTKKGEKIGELIIPVRKRGQIRQVRQVGGKNNMYK